MKKHTPGPWMSFSDGSKSWVKSQDKFVASMSDDIERCDADSRLISAAPEMLEALELAANILMNAGQKPIKGNNFYIIDQAIKKAKGLK